MHPDEGEMIVIPGFSCYFKANMNQCTPFLTQRAPETMKHLSGLQRHCTTRSSQCLLILNLLLYTLKQFCYINMSKVVVKDNTVHKLIVCVDGVKETKVLTENFI